MSIDIQGYKIEACPACGILFDVKRVMDNYEYEITHIHSGLGLQEGYVMLSLGKPRFWFSMEGVE
jgi:hypothetical protein